MAPIETVVTGLALSALAASAGATTLKFDQDRIGTLPADWIAGVTGNGSPRWTVEADMTAPSAPHVLRQSGHGTFPWCVRKGVLLADGFVAVKFKPLSGKVDQAGGVVWRWQDGGHYYVARANALENNVSLYYTEGGTRKTLKVGEISLVGDSTTGGKQCLDQMEFSFFNVWSGPESAGTGPIGACRSDRNTSRSRREAARSLHSKAS